MIINGQLVHGFGGVAGEFGHVTINPDGPLCRCGNRGCWEVMASNLAASSYYTRNGSKNKISEKPADGPAFNDLLNLAQQGDARAREALDLMAHYLGAGLSTLITGLAPEAILIVGEVTRAWERVGPIIEKVIQQRSLTHARIRIIPTDPSEQPRLRGTIALVLQKHFSAPSIA